MMMTDPVDKRTSKQFHNWSQFSDPQLAASYGQTVATLVRVGSGLLLLEKIHQSTSSVDNSVDVDMRMKLDAERWSYTFRK